MFDLLGSSSQALFGQAMIGQAPWKDRPWARLALSTAARAIWRGRHLTDREKLENLAAAIEDGGLGAELARRVREAVR